MADGSLGQDDIDKMLSELGVGGPASAEPEAPKPPSAVQAAVPAPAKPPTARVEAAPAPPKPATPAPEPSGALDQDAIDALVAQAAEVVAAPTTSVVASTGGGHLDQSEIDKLLADLDPQSRKSNATSTASAATHLDQKDIDRLLSELDVTAGSASEMLPATGKQAPGATPVGTAAVKAPAPAPTASKTSAPAVSKAAAPAATANVAKPEAAAPADGPLSQDAIDKLLSDLGAPDSSIGAAKKAPAESAAAPRPMRKVPPAPQPVQTAPSKPADATQALTADEIDAIVAKQGSSAPPGSESEAVIAQSDIDALVKQLAQATGSPEANEVAEAIAGKAADIDRIQAEAGAPTGPEHTRDAVDVNSVLGHTASTASIHTPAAPLVGVATVATMEWKAARWLLAAAVLLLGVCSGALIVLTMSVSGLSGELRAGREVEHPAVDGYADKLRLALAKLDESDEAERARGVRWMEELKRQFPDRAGEVGLALARHFRGREAWRRAADEYAAALETTGGADDPRVLLEHADCLTRLNDNAGAIRQVYTLLAAEARWTAERDAAGRTMSGLDRNRQAIADAYLMLGRLLARDGASATAPVAAAQPHAASSPAPAPAAGGHH